MISMGYKMRLDTEFFERDTLLVAQGLLGKKLVCMVGDKYLSGTIVETEAYIGENDTACHASKGKTVRTEVMFGKAGVSYIYLIYGIYSMLNIVTEKEGVSAAVLIRAIDPVDGIDIMRANRKSTGVNITNGPGKLCQAFGIDKELNKQNLILSEKIWVEDFRAIGAQHVVSGSRIGISYASEYDQKVHRRFWIKNNRYVSKG